MRITTLEAEARGLKEVVDEIKDNHLVHLDQKLDKYHQEAMDKYDKLVMWLLGTVATAAISLFVQIIQILRK